MKVYTEKVEKAKKSLKLAAEMSKTYYNEPLKLCYSGGKDSDVLLHIARNCLKNDEFEVINSHTTVDAPETVYHIREVFDRLRRDGIKTTIKNMPNKNQDQITMWKLIVKKGMPPTANTRYCCQVLKEGATSHSIVALGIRTDESTNRRGRGAFEVRGRTKQERKIFAEEHAEEVYRESLDNDSVWDCTLIEAMRKNKDTVVNPIHDFTESDVWNYINDNKVEVVNLYKRGYIRVGCIGCPMATYKCKMREFADYPKIQEAWIRAFQRLADKRKAEGKEGTWNTGQDIYEWWIRKPGVKGQLKFDEQLNIVEE